MNFRSDNTAPVAEEIMAALTAVNHETAAAYGADAWSQRLDNAFSDLFETDVRVFTVASGTAATCTSSPSIRSPPAPPIAADFANAAIMRTSSVGVPVSA